MKDVLIETRSFGTSIVCKVWFKMSARDSGGIWKGIGYRICFPNRNLARNEHDGFFVLGSSDVSTWYVRRSWWAESPSYQVQ